MPGHVFLTHGDLTKLNCDAWLLPSDAGLHVTSGWLQRLPKQVLDRLDDLERGDSGLPDGWGDRGRRVVSFDGWSEGPRPYLVNVGGTHRTPVGWYLEGAKQFFRFVAEQHQAGGPVTGRPKPLVQLPLIGT